MSVLTADQRWLLWTVGLRISRALLSDADLQHYMQSMNGHYGKPLRGAPEWMGSYQTRSGKISSPGRVGDEDRCVVTAANIRAFRKTIPPKLITELDHIKDAQTAENRRTHLWCHCHWATGQVRPHQDFMGRDLHHPSDDEEIAHRKTSDRLIDRERICLRTILGIEVEPVGQLEIPFEMAI